MFLTTKARYAVMAMVEMSIFSSSKPMKLSDIATKQEIDLTYLEQIFAKLKKEGLVQSMKGPGGGYKISRDTSEISIYEIVSAAEENIKMTRCDKTIDGCMNDKSFCLTHHLWVGLENRIADYLKSIALADICNNNSRLRGICNDTGHHMSDVSKMILDIGYKA